MLASLNWLQIWEFPDSNISFEYSKSNKQKQMPLKCSTTHIRKYLKRPPIQRVKLQVLTPDKPLA